MPQWKLVTRQNYQLAPTPTWRVTRQDATLIKTPPYNNNPGKKANSHTNPRTKRKRMRIHSVRKPSRSRPSTMGQWVLLPEPKKKKSLLFLFLESKRSSEDAEERSDVSGMTDDDGWPLWMSFGSPPLGSQGPLFEHPREDSICSAVTLALDATDDLLFGQMSAGTLCRDALCGGQFLPRWFWKSEKSWSIVQPSQVGTIGSYFNVILSSIN